MKQDSNGNCFEVGEPQPQFGCYGNISVHGGDFESLIVLSGLWMWSMKGAGQVRLILEECIHCLIE